MTHRHSLWTLMFPGAHLCKRLTLLEARFMSDIDDLRGAISQVGTDLGEAVTRIEERLANADVDLSTEIGQLRSFSEQLDSIAVDTPTEEPPPGEEPPPEVTPFEGQS